MKTISYRTIDKTSWPRGAWDHEPDKVQWTDKSTGFPCLAVRHAEWGHWCGYVGVPEGHPMYEKGGDGELLAHGGVNFAARCSPGNEATDVCHVPGPGEPDAVWWLGFDCAHAFDLMPSFPHTLRLGRDSTYRTLRYVRRECRELAQQLQGVVHDRKPANA